MRKTLVVMILIFVIISFARIFLSAGLFAFNDSHSYMVAEQAESALSYGVSISADGQSGGMHINFLTLYHVLLGIVSFFTSIIIGGRVLTILLSSSIVFPVYFYCKHMTKDEAASVVAAVLSAFIPAYVFGTTNSLSGSALSIPIMVLVMYFFLKVRKDTKIFVILLTALIFTGPAVHIFVSGLLIFMLFSWTEKLRVRKAEIELILFSLFLVALSDLILYRAVIVKYGLTGLLYDLLRTGEALNLEGDSGIISVVLNIGIVPLLSSFMIFMAYIAKKKKKSVYLPMSIMIVSFSMSLLGLVPYNYGLSVMGVMSAILSGELFSLAGSYVDRTKFRSWKPVFYLGMLAFIFLTSVIPSFYAAAAAGEKSFSSDLITSLEKLKVISDGDVVVSSPDIAPLISYYSDDEYILDDEKIYHDRTERSEDVRLIFTSAVASTALMIMQKYDADYIILDDSARIHYNITRISYAGGDCFPAIISEGNVTVYRRACGIKK